MIRVVIADDHPLARLAVRSYLDGEEDFDVVSEAETGQEAVELVRRDRPDVILLDYQMPVLDGLEAARAIGRDFPKVGMVMLTAVDDGQVAQEATGAGVGGVVLKTDPPEVLADALREAASGRSATNGDR